MIHETFEHLLTWRGSSPLGSGSSHPEEGAWGYPLPLSPPSPLAQVNTSFSEFNTFVVFYFAKVLFKIFFISVHIYLELFIIDLRSQNHFCEEISFFKDSLVIWRIFFFPLNQGQMPFIGLHCICLLYTVYIYNVYIQLQCLATCLEILYIQKMTIEVMHQYYYFSPFCFFLLSLFFLYVVSYSL